MIATIMAWFGLGKVKLIAIGVAVVSVIVLVTGLSVKLYLAGKHAAELEQLKAQAEALVEVVEEDARQARLEAETVLAENKRYKEILDAVPEDTDSCLSPDVLERLQSTIGKGAAD